MHDSILPNHPYDAHGSLSYLRGGKGAYGYLIHGTIEGDQLSVPAIARVAERRLEPAINEIVSKINLFRTSHSNAPLPLS